MDPQKAVPAEPKTLTDMLVGAYHGTVSEAEFDTFVALDTAKRAARREADMKAADEAPPLKNLAESELKRLIRALGNAPDSELAWLGRRIRQAEASEKELKRKQASEALEMHIQERQGLR